MLLFQERYCMNIVKKSFLYLKKEGLRKTLARTAGKTWEILAHAPYQLEEKLFAQKYAARLQERIAGKKVYILIPCIDWNIPIFQRPHQIATVLAAEPDAHVLFVSDEYRYDNFAGMQTVSEHLDLVSWRIIPQLTQIYAAAESVTVFMSWPRQAALLEHIPYQKLVYEYIDDLSLFYYYTQELIDKHYALIREADLTICTARSLYEDALPYTQRILLSPNAGDYNFFHDNRDCAPRADLVEKVQGYHCVLGYYGCMASWFDYDLVLEVARKKPDWCFVFVCYCFDGTIDRLNREKLPNIILYPAQPYQKLPSFITSFDIQTIPFVIDDITKATSPVKLFEYMASGKPILTSRLPECLQYESVVTYRDADDFIQKAEQLLHEAPDSPYFQTMEKEAKENTWQARIDEILAYLEANPTDPV